MEFIADYYHVELDDVIERRATHRGIFVARMTNKYIKNMPNIIQFLIFGVEIISDIKHIQVLAQAQKLKNSIANK